MFQLFENVLNIDLPSVIMWVIGGILIYLAIKRDMEPALLLPMGFGAILVNLPMSGAVTQKIHDTSLWRGSTVWYLLHAEPCGGLRV